MAPCVIVRRSTTSIAAIDRYRPCDSLPLLLAPRLLPAFSLLFFALAAAVV